MWLRKRTALAIAALALGVAGIALFGNVVASRAWSNAGMLALSRVLRSSDPGMAPLRRFAQAEALLRKALELDDHNAPAHRGLGFILWDQGSREQAGEEWRAGGIPYADFRRVAARANRAGDSENALDWYYRAIVLAPAASDAYASAATVLFDMGEEGQALALIDQALALDAFDSESAEVTAHFNRAEILRKMERSREAMAEYEWVVERRPNDYWAHIRLGALLWEVEQDAVRTEGLFLRAAEINPAAKWAYSRLGGFYREVGRSAEALQMYLRVLAIDSTDESAQKAVQALSDGGGQ